MPFDFEDFVLWLVKAISVALFVTCLLVLAIIIKLLFYILVAHGV